MFRYFILGIISIFVVICGACSGKEKKVQADPQDLQLAERYGREAAIGIAEIPEGDTVTIERRLLDLRAREGALRRAGHTEVADRYVNTFLHTLDSLRPSLRADINQ